MTTDTLLLPRNAWGGTVDPDQLAANIVSKMSQQGGVDTDLASAKSALWHTSKPRGRTRVYYQSYAEELIVKVTKAGVSADSSAVHSLLAEGDTDDVFFVRMALATHPNDMDAARTMLQQQQKDVVEAKESS
jgi:hypothetical protein